MYDAKTGYSTRMYDERPNPAALAKRMRKDNVTGETRAIIMHRAPLGYGASYDVCLIGVFSPELVAIYRRSKTNAVHSVMISDYKETIYRPATQDEIDRLPPIPDTKPLRRARTMERLD